MLTESINACVIQTETEFCKAELLANQNKAWPLRYSLRALYLAMFCYRVHKKSNFNYIKNNTCRIC
jgi:hypothetical protein